MRGNIRINLLRPFTGEATATGARPVVYADPNVADEYMAEPPAPYTRYAIRHDRRGSVSVDGSVEEATWHREYEVRTVGLDSPAPGWRLVDLEEERVYSVVSVTRPNRRRRMWTLAVEAAI